MASILPNVPYGTEIAPGAGPLPSVWSTFFRSLYTRVGSAAALTNTELAAIHENGLASLQTQVNTLTAEVSALNTEVTVLSGLTNGRQL